MGVPKFYRWISERYPCLSEVVREYQIPEFDNLYLDMNGIIHLCSHPNDDDPHFRITEAQIFADIFHYIECLFRMIKPGKVFFMAVDGVAPRAKMNQQRGRRFRSAREASDSEKKAIQRGEVLPSEERFDSNCITPGTEFMARLNEQLKYFVNMKISTDTIWQGPRIYLSGHETPGEGEHKIMDFIRSDKSKPDYDPNTRHCLYGLDADLMMLGLCTHEPHFSLLREEVRFTGKKSQKRTPTPEETTFHLLHLSLMREYLEHEFSSLKDKISFEFDIEMIINDWVLMGFLIGNDFIPNLPNMHIVHGALPLLYQTYIYVLPTLDGYINEAGNLNLVRFEKYMKKLAEHDYEHFNENYTDFKWLDTKRKCSEEENGQIFRGKRLKARIEAEKKKIDRANNFIATQEEEVGDDDGKPLNNNEMDEDDDDVPTGKLIDYGNSDDEEEEEAENDDEEEDTFELEFRQHKRDYYVSKLDYEQVTPAVLRDQAECYVRAIQWNLHYYYNGVCSWSWYYPHHYAPFISDITNFSHLKLEYNLDTPFLPFEQLLAVLPSASCKLLPKPFQSLMCNSDSPIIDYYPADFETDLNGKQQDWEAVVLIPFINEERLLNGMRPLYEFLMDEERQRNRHGPCLLYTFTKELQDPYPSSLLPKFPNVEINHAKCTEIPLDGFHVERSKLVKGLCDGIRLDVFFPGFPTLKHIPHKAYLKKAEVKVFQMLSRSDNMILEIEKRMEMTLEEAADELLEKVVYVGWPHLTEAVVTSVANLTAKCLSSKSSKQFLKENLTRMESVDWTTHRDSIKERYFRRWGVDIKNTEMMVFAKPLIGRKYTCTSSGRVTLEKQWATTSVPYALQTIIKDIAVHDASFQQYATLEELFTPNSCVFTLDLPNYGLMGVVEKVQSKPNVSISVRFEVPEEPNLDPILKKQGIALNDYLPSYIVAQRLAIGSQLLSRITSTFFVKMGSRNRPVNQRTNIGLNLKFSRKNIEVPGFTKKYENDWLYSPKAIEVIGSYISRFPELFDFLAANLRKETIYQEELTEVYQGEKILNVIQEFLKSLPCYQSPQQQCGGELLPEELVKAIEEACDKVSSKNSQPKYNEMEMSGNVLYRPNNFRGSAVPDRTVTFRLLDRVVNVRDGFTVPLGLRGTIIGIHIDENGSDVVYDVLFDRDFNGAITIRGSKSRGYQVPPYALINLSHGLHLEQQQQNQKPMAVVHPQAAMLNGYASQSKSATKATKNGKQNVSETIKANNKPQGRYPNTINHSPNSPFISRQTPVAKPQFVTPRLPTTSSRGSSRQPTYAQQQIQSGGGGNVHRGPESDFKNIWERLKQVQTQPNVELRPLTLSQAAKTLPKHNSKRVYLKGGFKESDDSSSTNWRLRQQPPMPKFPSASGTRIVENTEFVAMLQALDKAHNKERANKAQQMETGAVNELTKLLQNISVNSKEKGDHKSKSDQSLASKPNSGIRLTVDQLFNETRKHEQKVKETSHKSGPSKVPTDRNGPQSKHREDLDQNLSSQKYIELLRNLCNQRFGSIPIYEYKNVSHNIVLAKVHLPRGTVSDGGRGRDEQEAAENAAKIAYLQMVQPGTLNPLVTVPLPVSQQVRLPAYHIYQKQQQLQQQQAVLQQRMGNPYLLQNPYASSYLHGAMGYVPHHILKPYPPPPPSYLTSPWATMVDPVNNLMELQLQQCRAAPRSENPFVPLQVTKQNMTPKKRNFDSVSYTERPPPPPLMNSANLHTKGLGGGGYDTGHQAPLSPREKSRGKVVTSSIVPLIGGGSRPPGHRRNKSRLAINFGSPLPSNPPPQ